MKKHYYEPYDDMQTKRFLNKRERQQAKRKVMKKAKRFAQQKDSW